MTYLSCQPEQVEANLAAFQRVFDDVNRNGISADELEQARNKVASRIVLRGERPMGRMSSLGGNWVYRGQYRSIADDLKTIRSVTLEQIRDVLDQYPLKMVTTAGVGPLQQLRVTNDTGQ
jgi:predicted Zn-dependent peptidase